MLIIAGPPEVLAGTKDPSAGKLFPLLKYHGIRTSSEAIIEPVKVQYWKPLWEGLFEEVEKENRLPRN
jgi:hypothetical protein